MVGVDARGGVRVRLADLLTDGRLPAACPSRVVLDHVTSKWGVLLLLALSEGDLRWGELRRTVEGISEKMLAQTLRTLEADGLVDRTVTATVPPRVDYALTPLGVSLRVLCGALKDWAEQHMDDILDARDAYDERVSGRGDRATQRRRRCGRVIGVGDRPHHDAAVGPGVEYLR